MKIRIQLFNPDLIEPLMVHIPVTNDDDVDDVICTTLIKLMRSSWSLTPGDTIKITEV